MWIKDESSRWWRLVLLLFALLFFARTGSAQEAEAYGTPPSIESTPSTEMQPIDPWASFDSLWTSLKDELTQSDADSQRLLISLEELRIEVDALRSSLTESMKLYEQSEAARVTERMAGDKIIEGLQSSRDAWRLAALVSAGVALALATGVTLSIIF